MMAKHITTLKSSAIMKSMLLQRCFLKSYLSYMCLVTTLVNVQCHDSKGYAGLHWQHSTAQHSTAQLTVIQYSTT